LQYAGGGGAVGGKVVVRNSLEAGTVVHWEDRTDSGLVELDGDRVKIDDRTD
jgi:hypothetical protein